MRSLILLSIIFTTPLALAEAIYKEIGPDGVPVFSDQKLPNGEIIEVKEPMTFSDPIVKQRLQKRREDATRVKPRAVKYILAITDPADNSSIRNNAGNLTLNVTLSPGLAPGHTAHLVMDGTAIRPVTGSGGIALSNVDRGTHQFNIRVTNAKGELVEEGPSSSITVLRASKLNRAN